MRKVLLLLFISIMSMSLYAQSDSYKPHQSLQDQTKITVYPNPAVDYIAITDSNEKVQQIIIYNLIGRKVKSFVAAPDTKYGVSELPKGMYIVQLLDKRKKVVTTQRVSKR